MAESIVLAAGSVLVLFSAFCFAAGVWRELFPGPPPPVPDVRRIPPALLMGVNGFLILIALAALVGSHARPAPIDATTPAAAVAALLVTCHLV